MTICDKYHAEVCFEGHDCPACDLAHQRDRFEAQVKELEAQNGELLSQVEDLKSQS